MKFPNVAVVGMFFREKEGVPAKTLVENMVPPLSLTLIREPENPFDNFAIKVIYQGQHIGYIESSQAMWIAPHMDEGAEATCTVDRLEERKNNLHPICTIRL